MKRLLSTADLVQHMKDKGILFNIISEGEAKEYLDHNNYFFKLASYRNNYTKRQRGSQAGRIDEPL